MIKPHLPQACLALIFLVVMMGDVSKVEAQSEASLPDIVREMHDIDAHGQWFSMSIAILGSAPGATLGSLALISPSSLGMGHDNRLAQGSALVMVGSSAGLVVHGMMRIYERRTSAATAELLLDNPELMNQAGILYLRDRAHKAHSTRFAGGVLTIIYGASTSLLGTGLLLDDGANHALGYTLLPLGILGIGVGAIHFIGTTRPEKMLKRGEESLVMNLQWTPQLQVTPDHQVLAGLSLSGSF